MNVLCYAKRMIRSALEKILDIVFPPSAIEREIRTLSPETLSEKLSISEHNGVTALFSYADPLIRQMIWRLKYKNDRRVAELFGEVLHDFLLEELADETIFSGHTPTLIPIPLSRRRKHERGYNQVELVARTLAELDGVDVRTDILRRAKHTKSQTSLKSRSARKANVKGVFRVSETNIPFPTRIILIDDVLTTGSTLREARRTLKDAGAKEVRCVTLAH